MITRSRAISIFFALAVLPDALRRMSPSKHPWRARGSPAPIKSGSTISSPTRPGSPPIPL